MLTAGVTAKLNRAKRFPGAQVFTAVNIARTLDHPFPEHASADIRAASKSRPRPARTRSHKFTDIARRLSLPPGGNSFLPQRARCARTDAELAFRVKLLWLLTPPKFARLNAASSIGYALSTCALDQRPFCAQTICAKNSQFPQKSFIAR